jgi:O-antigen ligase
MNEHIKENVLNNYKPLVFLNFFILLLASTFFFERIPSIETTLGPIRLFNVVIPLTLFTILAYGLRKQIDFSKYSIPKETLVLFLFLFCGTFSFFNVINVNRYLAAYISLIFCSLSIVLLSIFKIDSNKLLRLFVYLFIAQFIFSAYQFIGDRFLKLTPDLTGLKDLFQSNVFGIPRVHNTYNEPAYYANALFLGIFLFLFLSFSKVNLFWKDFKYFNFVYFGLFLIAVFIFIITLAKSAWLILPLPLLIAIFFIFTSIDSKILKSTFVGVMLLAIIAFGISTRLAPNIVNGITNQFIDTVEGSSATSVERSAYSDAAKVLIPDYLLIGIGPGQFGTYANDIIIRNLYPTDVPDTNPYFVTKPNVNYLNKIDTEKNIVFNVYLEVLLEYGLIAFTFYLLFLIITLGNTFIKIISNKLILDETNILRIALAFYIICSLGQFVFISPVYINPFFVALGLLISLNQNYEKPIIN